MNKKLMKAKCLCILVLLVGCCMTFTSLARGTEKMTAQQAFIKLPPDIFLYTAQPLSEEGKMLLATNGATHSWAITYVDDDSLEALTLRGEYGAVLLHLYRTGESGLVAYGAITDYGCSLEFWNYDAFGGFVPNPTLLNDFSSEETPQLPPLQLTDFFNESVTLSQNTQPVFYICLRPEFIEGVVHFINEGTRVDIPVENQVFYEWNGTTFMKNKKKKSVEQSKSKTEKGGLSK